MKALITLLLLTIGAQALLAEDTNGAAFYKALGDRGREIKQRLAAYDQTKDYMILGQVMGLTERITFTNSEMPDAVLSVYLEILSRCLSRDQLLNVVAEASKKLRPAPPE